MNCAKVLLSCFERNFGCKRLILTRNFESTFTCGSGNVEPHSKLSMMEDLFDPPSRVRGMKKLDKSAFKKTINASCLIGHISDLHKTGEILKKFSLKVHYLKPLQKIEGNLFRVLLDPKIISSWNDFDESIQQKLKSLSINEDNFSEISVDLGFENWNSESLLKAILPKDFPLTSYSMIGHIIHLNIKDELLEYKYVIAEILFEKIHNCKTVVYKKNSIHNVYRNFEMELLCGEPNFVTSVTENHCQFELDFSKVYWNPRLSSEHMRIVNEINEKDVLFDVFAGVGPFAIPAAKKKCLVFANDLNPDSFQWLNHNITLNKKAKDYIVTFNKDGKDFILKDIRENLIQIWQNDLFDYKIHVVMNLPAVAPTFMVYFNKLIKKRDLVNADINRVKKCLPIINCYFFVKTGECQKAVFEEASLMNLNNIEHSFHFIRKVSSCASMIKVKFSLPYEYIVSEEEVDSTVNSDEPLAKRICTR